MCVCVECSAGGEWTAELLSVHRPTSEPSVNNVSLESSLLQQIQADFTTAADLYSADVGGLHWVDSVQMFVAFFLASDSTDRDRKARNRLPGGPQLHNCDINTTDFSRTHLGPPSSTAFEREREFRNLVGYLGSVLYRSVCEFPCEQLLCADNASSVSERLRRHLMSSGTSTGVGTAASVVFLRTTGSSSVVHSQLLRRVFRYAENQLLTTRRSVYIVTDVGLGVGLSTLDRVLQPASTDVHTAVHSGAKPLFSPITCVVIAVHLSST